MIWVKVNSPGAFDFDHTSYVFCVFISGCHLLCTYYGYRYSVPSFGCSEFSSVGTNNLFQKIVEITTLDY
jgi:hypothetical protein